MASFSDAVAPIGFAPKAWQTAAPDDMFVRGDPVGNSADLERILALPRRPPLDLTSVTAEALIDYEMTKYSRPNAACRCREIDPQRFAEGGVGCITRFLPLQAWALYEMCTVGGIIAAAPVGGGKCHARGTEFLDYTTGCRRQIEDAGSLEVATFDKTLKIADAAAFPSGFKECVRVVLRDGCAATPSTDHPYLTHRGWVHAYELRPGVDFVAVATEMPELRNLTSATDDEVAFVAYMLSDGGCSQATMTFTNMTPEIIEDWKRCSMALGYGVSEGQQRSKARQFNLMKGSDRSSTCGTYKGVEDRVRVKWGLYGLSKNKRTHASLWGLPREQVALFLNRFWACDGHVQKTRGVEMTLASEALVDDVRFLCTRLGIRTRKQFKVSSYVKNGVRHKFDAWRITAYGAAALKFLDEVGDVLGKEDACRALREALESSTRNTNTDVVPVGPAEFKEICDELGDTLPRERLGDKQNPRTRSEISRWLGITRGQCISRARFVEFCSRWNYTGKYAHLATTDVAWERVDSVSPVGVHDVYDLTVPGTHNFVANGMIVHNTLIGILSALALRDCPVCLLLVPASLIEQIKTDYLLLKEHFRVPNFIVHGGDGNGKFPAIAGEPILHVLPYSLMSSNKNSNWIENLAPNAIIADEVDALKDMTSSRTMRLLRYFEGADCPPEMLAARARTRFCGWTGSFIDHSITEIGHLFALALRMGSPLPLDKKVRETWSRAVDPVASPCPPGALMRLAEPGESVQAALRRRFADTPGFLVSTSSEVVVEAAGERRVVELDIREREAPPLPAIIEEALEKVRSFQRPDTLDGESEDDEELEDPLAQAKCAAEVASGLCYRWVYPRGEPKALIRRWFAARKDYTKEQRLKKLVGEKHLDSSGLCEAAAMRAWGDLPEVDGLPCWKADSWPAWRDIRDQVQPQPSVFRIHDYLVQDAVAWGRENRGIIWYGMVEFAQWAHEISGFTIHGGGPGAERRLRAETGERTILASIKSHGRGRNGLQFIFDHQLIAQMMASATAHQQLLGRLHRRGQRAGCVRTEVYLHTPEILKAFNQALRRGEFVQSILGETQKLLAGYVRE